MSHLMAEVLDAVLAGDDYQMFRRKYFNRLPDFMADCFRYEDDEGPTDYHLRMARKFRNFRTEKRTFQRAEVGKGVCFARGAEDTGSSHPK